MSAANVIALVSAIVAALGLCLAATQYVEGKHRTRTERERLAAQRERLRTAVTAAKVGAATADLVVQRAKDANVTTAELQSIARTLRGSLLLLASQLENEGDEVAGLSGQPRFTSDREVDAEPSR
jgi:uncharacterized protein HemX